MLSFHSKGTVLSALLFFGCIAPAVSGCGKSPPSSSENDFVTAAREVAPAVGRDSGSAAIILSTPATAAAALSKGGILDTINEALRDYQAERDNGTIDMHNIFKVLSESGNILETAKEGCESTSNKEINAPYDLGLLDQTYDCAGSKGTMADAYANGFALRSVGEKVFALLTYRWAPSAPSHVEHGILQGSLDKSTGDLEIRMTHLVNYEAGEGFVVRSHITGNAATHAFTLNMITKNLGASESWISVSGKGISRGVGNSYLMKASSSEGVSGGYFCFPADVSDAKLEAMQADAPNGSSTVEETCTGYQSDVDAITALQSTEVPSSISDFSDSTILLTL